MTRHRKGMSKMSVFSSETALEMASIFATRDSASRASQRSLASPEPDSGPTPKLSPLAEESPRLPSENDPTEVIMTHSPARSRLRSIPLSDELLSDGEVVASDPLEVADGEISPYPKATSPPRAIPDRSTSLQNTTSTVQLSPSSTFGPESILKRTVQPAPEQRRFVLSLPSTLSQILNLFEPGTTRLAPGLSPGMLEIELLKIVESERQKASLQGLIWSRQDTVRVSWLLDEIKHTVSSLLEGLIGFLILTPEYCAVEPCACRPHIRPGAKLRGLPLPRIKRQHGTSTFHQPVSRRQSRRGNLVRSTSPVCSTDEHLDHTAR